jgi:nucleoside-diphosphate-sugar epimerase
MKVLVTGANGFIGRHLCGHLSAQGHSVTAVARRPPGFPIGAAEVAVVADHTAINASLFQGCDCVIHLAARAHVLKDKADNPLAEFRAANANTAKRWADEAGRNGVQRFVLVSSIGVNGAATAGAPFSEASAAAPGEPYAISKLEAENMLRLSARHTGMEYVIVRPPLVYGPGAPGNFALILKLAAAGWPLPFGSMAARRSLLSVWNLADFLRRCVESPAAKDELFLLADREDIALPELFKYLGEGFGRANAVFPFPPRLLSLAARLLGKGKAFDKLGAELLIDSSKARQALGWSPPYSAADAMRRTGQELRMACRPPRP